MTRQVPFTEYEAVLLLDAFLSTLSGTVTRREAIQDCSDALRRIAVNKGIEIDDIYRNTNGITFQMASMESAYRGRTLLKPATKLFAETVEMYISDRKKYERMLKEVKSMAEDKSNHEEMFIEWLSKKVSPAQLSELYMALFEIEQYAVKTKMIEKSLLYESIDIALIKKVRGGIEQNNIFRFTHKKQMGRINSALNYLSQYAQEAWQPSEAIPEPILDIVTETEPETALDTEPEPENNAFVSDHRIESTDSEREDSAVTEIKAKPACDMQVYEVVLEKYFPRGYRLGSPIEMKRFRRYYEELNGIQLSLENELAEVIIRQSGIEHEGRVYAPQAMIDDKLKDRIFRYVEKCLAEGKTALYFEAIFREFSEEFLEHNIYDANMLKTYISYMAGGKYYIGKSYLSYEQRSVDDPIDEVRTCLKEYSLPMKVEELCSTLSHIPSERIKMILGTNLEFVRNGKGEYFHADVLALSDEELENISLILNAEIELHGYISGNELYESIISRYPYLKERNTVLSFLGWRDALKYKLGKKYSFAGNIISEKGKNLSMSDVFANFAKEQGEFTLQELLAFAETMGSVVYFDALYEHAARISYERFVGRDAVHFQVKETDKILDRFCTGTYLAIPKITDFGIFPEASHPWTTFLLESYLARWSERYYLMHGGYNQGTAVGAMVKKEHTYTDFDELTIDVLAESGVTLQKEAALKYLSEHGYIARKYYTNIEALLIRAREKRNKREN